MAATDVLSSMQFSSTSKPLKPPTKEQDDSGDAYSTPSTQGTIDGLPKYDTKEIHNRFDNVNIFGKPVK